MDNYRPDFSKLSTEQLYREIERSKEWLGSLIEKDHIRRIAWLQEEIERRKVS